MNRTAEAVESRREIRTRVSRQLYAQVKGLATLRDHLVEDVIDEALQLYMRQHRDELLGDGESTGTNIAGPVSGSSSSVLSDINRHRDEG